LSIGALSAATGIPVDTIRSWERRYGFPVAERKPSGHRVYPLEAVPRLRRVAEAMRRGHRAAEVLGASDAVLDALLESVPAFPSPPDGGAVESADLIQLVASFNAERLKLSLQSDWVRMGPIQFLQQRVGPLLVEVGTAWSEGRLDVRHEHFASAVLGDFLRAVRAPLDDRAGGPIAAIATLPGELHGLGLQMCALVFALAGWRALILGVNTPIAEVAALAREAPVSVVAISCVRRPRAGALGDLRKRLPRRVPLLVGGSGSPPSERGIETLTSLMDLDRWLQSHRAA
jgi:methanogenic corrinoid protein MtbC1